MYKKTKTKPCWNQTTNSQEIEQKLIGQNKESEQEN